MRRSAVRFVLLLAVAALLAACGTGTKTRRYSVIDPKQPRETVYIIPFDATLVPPEFGDPIFNEFVDYLNSRRKQTRVGRFVILKEELKEIEPAWLIKQTYVSGDVWGYIENSGCCSTDIKVKSRIYLYEPGTSQPSSETFIPAEEFFEHDRTNVATAKARLGKRLAHDLANAILKQLTP